MRWPFLVASVFFALMALLFTWAIILYPSLHFPSWRVVPALVLVVIWISAAYEAHRRFKKAPRPESTRGRQRALLVNRTAAILVLALCVIEGAWAWASIKGGPHRVGLVYIPFYVFVILVAALIAYRSSFWLDRLAFAAIALAFMLFLIRATLLTQAVSFAAGIARAILWTAATAASLLALLRCSKPSR